MAGIAYSRWNCCGLASASLSLFSACSFVAKSSSLPVMFASLRFLLGLVDFLLGVLLHLVNVYAALLQRAFDLIAELRRRTLTTG